MAGPAGQPAVIRRQMPSRFIATVRAAISGPAGKAFLHRLGCLPVRRRRRAGGGNLHLSRTARHLDREGTLDHRPVGRQRRARVEVGRPLVVRWPDNRARAGRRGRAGQALARKFRAGVRTSTAFHCCRGLRVATRLVEPWMRMDGAKSFADWTPNLANAPFRLLAIVYRPDLGIVDRNGAIKAPVKSASSSPRSNWADRATSTRRDRCRSPSSSSMALLRPTATASGPGRNAGMGSAASPSASTTTRRCRRSPTALHGATANRHAVRSTRSAAMKASPCPGSCASFMSRQPTPLQCAVERHAAQ